MRKIDEIGLKTLQNAGGGFFRFCFGNKLQLTHIYEKIYELSGGAAYGPGRFLI